MQILEAPALARLDWLVHGFSTRLGGVSRVGADTTTKPERVLNLGLTDWDSRDNVAENRTRFFSALGASEMRAVTLRQVHSDIAHHVGASNPASGTEVRKGDALFTRERGVLLAVQTADCIPILLVDTKRKAIAAIHAGWRGTLQRIAEKTLGRMQMEFGSQPKDVVAALGPGIGRCCYEVGHDVAGEFAAKFANAREWFEGPFDAVASGDNDPSWLPWLTMKPPGHAPPPERVHLDLVAANRSILIAAGVAPQNISASGFCTACRTDLLFSYRRERTTGRLMAAIGIP
ncbi:MAG TPA: peptidoglycan editing factor PgeF [Candidatus Acidoferrales bacterium]|nr:peptidoglycan editing factor PgeF [Candidatus Acidoferrales bacterium]